MLESMSAFNITMLEGYTEHALFEHMRTCVRNEALYDFTIVFIQRLQRLDVSASSAYVSLAITSAE